MKKVFLFVVILLIAYFMHPSAIQPQKPLETKNETVICSSQNDSIRKTKNYRKILSYVTIAHHLYPKVWEEWLIDSFAIDLLKRAERVKIDPVVALQSAIAETNLNPRESSQGATEVVGLWQWDKDFLDDFGYDAEKIRKSNPLIQLRIWELDIQRKRKLRKYPYPIEGLGDYRCFNIIGRGMGKDPDFPLLSKDWNPSESARYERNKPLDVDRNGIITKREILLKANQYVSEFVSVGRRLASK